MTTARGNAPALETAQLRGISPSASASLFLILEVAGYRYAVKALETMAITPFVELRPLPTAVRGIVGVMNFRGTATPVADLSLAMGLAAVEPWHSARILIFKLTQARNFGLLAGRVIRTERIAEEDFQMSGVFLPDAPYLGPVLMKPGEAPVQWIQDPTAMLPDPIRDNLLKAADEALA